MKWDIFDEMQRMQEEMERMFTASTRTSCQGPGCIPEDRRPGSIPQTPQHIPGRMEPVADVQETDTSVIVTAEVLGLEKEDIDLRVTSENVEIRSKKNNGTDGEEFGKEFHRVVLLPVPVRTQGVEATCKNGVLEITLPKNKEVAKSQNIKIK
jgi:HSP20 family protein